MIYGFSAFFAAYAFLYIGLETAAVCVASVIMASAPLIVFALSVLQGTERFRSRAFVGSLISVTGIAVLSGFGAIGSVREFSFLILAALSASQSVVVLKKYEIKEPFMTNGVSMTLGAVLLIAASAVKGEQWEMPHGTDGLAVIYLVIVGTIAMFVLFTIGVRRWTASGMAYQFALIPIAAVVLAALILSEPITTSAALGGAIVILGTWVGALSARKSPVNLVPVD